MHIPVHDRDTLDPEHRPGVTGGDGDVPEHAEAHCAIWQRMVTRWPDEREAASLGRHDGAPCGKPRRLERRRAGRRVAVEPRLGIEHVDGLDVRRVVHALQLLPGRLAPRRCGPEQVQGHREPLLAFGMGEL